MNNPLRERSSEEKAIGIIGGVGPEAGTIAHRYIIKLTPEVKRDQDSLEVIHISSPDIPDRTDFLANKHNFNPAEAVFKVIQTLEEISKFTKRKIVALVPCNTFHAKPIFDQLKKLIQKNNIQNVELLNMVHETGKYIQTHFPKVKKIGLMSTSGTREYKIYHNLLEPMGYEIIEVELSTQPALHETIYNKEWGIKASGKNEKNTENFLSYAETLKNKGAEAIILGCTEIPIVLENDNFENIPLIDPMQAVAISAINVAKNKYQVIL